MPMSGADWVIRFALAWLTALSGWLVKVWGDTVKMRERIRFLEARQQMVISYLKREAGIAPDRGDEYEEWEDEVERKTVRAEDKKMRAPGAPAEEIPLHERYAALTPRKGTHRRPKRPGILKRLRKGPN